MQAQFAAAQAPYPPTYHSGNYSNTHSPIPTTASTASPMIYEQQWQHSTLPKSYLMAAGPGHDAFTGFKNELPADEIRPSEVASPSVHPITPTSPDGHDISRAYSDASAGRMSHDQRQDVAGGYYLSPQSTGSDTNHVEDQGPVHRGPPSELQG